MSRIIKLSDHEQYSIGDSLGRGAFGSVYRGLNTFSGETVAIKQIKLKTLQGTDAAEMMTEIELLKNLNHPNIVKYQCFYKGSDSLYIVLEYCENGSLQSICKTFGNFPEHLVALYTDQVLLGLVYLHEQGVIHRDIKGANILTTKDGKVKLADFGVAVSAQSDMTVVGSPYWMAPEIIELAGATSASDIWSLGCTVIELLQGHPPYSDLDSMSALFHIVDDEHPPFPDAASIGARDFLMRCFQKDPNLRTSAKKLRRHDWITKHARSDDGLAVKLSRSQASAFDEAVTSVKVYNEKVNAEHRQPKQRHDTASRPKISPARRKTGVMQKHVESGDEDWSKDLELSPSKKNGRRPLRLRTTDVKHNEDLDWDKDLQINETSFRSKLKVASMKHPERDLRKTTKPSGLSRRSPEKLPHLEDLTIRPSPSQKLRHPPSMPNVKNAHDGHLRSPIVKQALTPVRMQRTQSALSYHENRPRTGLSLKHYVDDNDNYDDVFTSNITTNTLMTHRSNGEKSTDGNWPQEDDTAEDPFAEIEEFTKENLSANVLREQKARAVQQAEQQLKAFHNSTNEHQALSHLQQLLKLQTDQPDVKRAIIASHGLLPLLEALETATEEAYVIGILELLNSLCMEDDEVQENIAFVGGITSIAKFADRKYLPEIRDLAAMFVKYILSSSDLNAQIFISCRGLTVLTEFLEEDYYESKLLVTTGITGTLRLFSLQGKYTPKNDLCRIMARAGVLKPLTHTLHILLTGEQGENDRANLDAILQIMINLAQADAYVKNLIATRSVLKRLLMDLHLMRDVQLISCLKFVRTLSSIPTTLDVLHNANAIERLVQQLLKAHDASHQEASNHALATLFNLCRVDKARQTEAAYVGIIPILKRIITDDRPLKDLAIPMFCSMAHNAECRKLLWSQNGLEFYLKLLGDQSWLVNAFEAVVIWYHEEPARIERRMIDLKAMTSITAAFSIAQGAAFESFLDHLQKLLKASSRLSRTMVDSDITRKVVQRLNHPRPNVRANLLKLLQSILEHTSDRSTFIKRHGIERIVLELSQSDPAVIVKALAAAILRSIE